MSVKLSIVQTTEQCSHQDCIIKSLIYELVNMSVTLFSIKLLKRVLVIYRRVQHTNIGVEPWIMKSVALIISELRRVHLVEP